MKSEFVCILLIVLMSCGEIKEKTEKSNSITSNHRETFSTAIHYDFANLKLNLNTVINDSNSEIEWRWDYMTSENSMPDTIGVDHYMNLSQPEFYYNGESTLPLLSITTKGKKIKRFSSTIIFHLEDESVESMERLLDSLKIIDLLQNDSVRQAVIDHHFYEIVNDNFEETIVLNISEEKYRHDMVTYEKKLTAQNNNH